MKKAELQRALTVSGLYTTSYQLSSLLNKLDTLDFLKEMIDDIENFRKLLDLIHEKCEKYLNELKVEE